jgi:hypothetical protein
LHVLSSQNAPNGTPSKTNHPTQPKQLPKPTKSNKIQHQSNATRHPARQPTTNKHNPHSTTACFFRREAPQEYLRARLLIDQLIDLSIKPSVDGRTIVCQSHFTSRLAVQCRAGRIHRVASQRAKGLPNNQSLARQPIFGAEGLIARTTCTHNGSPYVLPMAERKVPKDRDARD